MYQLHGPVELDSPVLVMALEGWIDAGLGGAGAMAALLEQVPSQPVATFDSDALIDHRARRPTLRIVDGVASGLTWPHLQLRTGQDRAGSDMLLLTGPEPDLRWHEFTASVVALAVSLGVRMAVGLGAFPAPVPHTRPVRLAATASSPELAGRVGFVPGTIEVPAGIQAALERGFTDAEVPAVGLWARVPHYAAALPYPAASATLLESLAEVAGLVVHTGDLKAAGAITLQRLDEIIANSDDHTAMVRQLESQVDAAESGPSQLDLANLPSGDEIAAELQRFLRGET